MINSYGKLPKLTALSTEIEIEKRILRYINGRLGGTGNKFSRKSRPSRRGCGGLVVEQFILLDG